MGKELKQKKALLQEIGKEDIYALPGDSFSGNNLQEDLKTAGWNIDNVSGYGSRSLIRAAVAKQSLMVLISYIQREYKRPTSDRKVNKVLNDAGFYSLSEYARKMNMYKQTLSKWVTKISSEYIIEVNGRNFYRWLQLNENI